MATLIWTAVYVFLCLEIGLLVGLLLPLPRRVIRPFLTVVRKAFAFQTPLVVVLVLLVLVFCESLRQQFAVMDVDFNQPDASMQYMTRFRAERNTYLSGFSLVFLFIIWRVEALLEHYHDAQFTQTERTTTCVTEIVQDDPVCPESSIQTNNPPCGCDTTIEPVGSEEHPKAD